ncbi:MAG: M14 family metallopeptidase, partial [Mariniphaga sp.]
MIRIVLFFVLMLSFVSYASANNGKIEVPLRFDRYYDLAEVEEALQALHKAYPEFTKLEVIGRSEEGREIYALTINNPKTGNELDKPGVYLDGNIHGNEIQAGEVCLYYANMLLTKYGENEKITRAVDNNAHYIIPVVNVDGRFHFFESGNTPSTNRTIRVPRDDDGDGLFDEDGPDDLDGDGNISQMRKKDPHGQFKQDPEDPRLMVRVEPGETGEYTILGYEGIDNDGDGKLNEDAEGYLDPNRNWGSNWKPQYVQNGAGNFPLSGVGLKSIAEYIAARPNIIVGYAFHNYGGMWLRAPADKSVRIPASDIAAFDVVGKEAVKITPGYVYHASHDLYPTFGDFTTHLYFVHGILGFVGELFMRQQETFTETKEKEASGASSARGSSDERNRELLGFNDYLTHGELFKEWEKFDHPQFGEIELGGWVKMSSRLPHPFMLHDLVHRNASVVLHSAVNTPEVKIEIADTEKLNGNLHKVKVRLHNKNGLPSMTAEAFNRELYRKDMLKVSGAKVIAGGKITDKHFEKVSYKEHKPEVQFLALPGYAVQEYLFLIEGK